VKRTIGCEKVFGKQKKRDSLRTWTVVEEIASESFQASFDEGRTKRSGGGGEANGFRGRREKISVIKERLRN